MGLISLAAPPAAAAYLSGQSFTNPGQYAYTIPTGTQLLMVTVVGASGGTGHGGTAAATSGSGAKVQATLVPPAGVSTLYVEVDQGGGQSRFAADGGGESAIQTCSNGSASCVYTANPSTDPRLVVAGGGGGGGENSFAVGSGGTGGNAGTSSGITGPGAGGDGTDFADAGRGGNAGFGDSAAVAVAGTASPDCYSAPTPHSAGLVGTPGQGGTGGDCADGADSDGGGGGAGWVGGSGGGAGDYDGRDGAGGGGGAGASYVESGATDVSISEAGSSPPEVIIVAEAAPTVDPYITSTQRASFVARAAGSFTVTTTGSPTPSLSESGALPAGVTFTDNGNGTATLGGIPAPGSEGNYPFTITATNGFDSNAVQAFDLSVVGPLGIETSSLPEGTVGTGYYAGLAAIGGTPPYSWTVSAGSLPAGLSLDSTTGAVYGTPTTVGTSTFTLTATDHSSPPQTAGETLGMSVVPPVLKVSTTSLHDGLVGLPYSADLQAAGGVQPYTWSLSSGALPVGLELNSVTGAIYGTPTAPGTSGFTVQVTGAPAPTPPESSIAAPPSTTPTRMVADAALSVTIRRITATTMVLELSPQTTATGGAVAVTGAVYGPYGGPVADEPVSLSLQRGNGSSPGSISPTVTTSVYGSFFTTFMAPSVPGAVTVTAAAYGVQAQAVELVTPSGVPVLGTGAATLSGACGSATASFVNTSATGCGTGQIVVSEYGSPPTPTPPVGGAVASFDAAVSTANTFTSVTITQCGVKPGDTLFWYDVALAAWEPVSPAATYHDDGCLAFTASADSSPKLSELYGTVFAVVQPPTVTALSPSSGPVSGGTGITIRGSGFTSPASVSFGSSAATNVVVDSPTQITATTPAGSGAVDVGVTDSEGSSATGGAGDTFTYIPAPDLASLSPTAGTSGTLVQLSGNRFGTVTGTVYWTQGTTTVPQTPATPDWSDGLITTAVPASLSPGSATVAVDNATTGLLSNALTFDVISGIVVSGLPASSSVSSVSAPTAPAVSGVNPPAGPAGGGTAVTISGSGFSGVSAVDFGTTPATSFIVVSATQIDAVSPSGQGAVNVSVSGPSGRSKPSAADTFTYSCASAPTFPDVPASAPEYGAVETLACAGIVDGYPNGTFQPNGDVTRAEFVKMLDLTIGLQPVANGVTRFTDVPSTAWYAPYVAAAVARGIVDGVTATSFAPNAPITRQQMAVMLARALDLTGTTRLSFSDTNQIAPWALPSVEAAVQAGYLKGLPNGTFEPLAPTTRADAAYVLAAVLQARGR